MRHMLAIAAVVLALTQGSASADAPMRRDLMTEEAVIQRGETLSRCFDVDDGYLSFRVSSIRTPIPEVFRAMLYRADGEGVRAGAPLLETVATPDGTSSVHRIDRGTYCLAGFLSKHDGVVAPYGVVYLHLSHEPA